VQTSASSVYMSDPRRIYMRYVCVGDNLNQNWGYKYSILPKRKTKTGQQKVYQCSEAHERKANKCTVIRWGFTVFLSKTYLHSTYLCVCLCVATSEYPPKQRRRTRHTHHQERARATPFLRRTSPPHLQPHPSSSC
jgi:hypothetical protein